MAPGDLHGASGWAGDITTETGLPAVVGGPGPHQNLEMKVGGAGAWGPWLGLCPGLPGPLCPVLIQEENVFIRGCQKNCKPAITSQI